MSLPNGGCREDVIRTEAFEDYIRNNVVNWFNWTQKNRLGVDRMEDLILVTGYTLVGSWAAAVVVDNNIEAEISLATRALPNGGAKFVWSNIRGPVAYHNSRVDQVRPPGYVYSACTNFLFVVWKGSHSGSMRLYQGIPSKAPFFLFQKNACCSRTRS